MAFSADRPNAASGLTADSWFEYEPERSVHPAKAIPLGRLGRQLPARELPAQRPAGGFVRQPAFGAFPAGVLPGSAVVPGVGGHGAGPQPFESQPGLSPAPTTLSRPAHGSTRSTGRGSKGPGRSG